LEGKTGMIVDIVGFIAVCGAILIASTLICREIDDGIRLIATVVANEMARNRGEQRENKND